MDRVTALGWYESQVENGYLHTMPAHNVAEFQRVVRSRFDEFARPDGTYDPTYVRLEAFATLAA